MSGGVLKKGIAHRGEKRRFPDVKFKTGWEKTSREPNEKKSRADGGERGPSPSVKRRKNSEKRTETDQR